MPDTYQQLVRAREVLEDYFCDACDIEFTIEKGQLFILNARIAKREPRANLRFALQFLAEGKIGIADVLRRVKPVDVEYLTLPEIRNRRSLELLGRGLAAGAGVATGRIVFDASDAIRLAHQGGSVVLVKDEVASEDIAGIRVAQAILTCRGGRTSHAALAARGWGKCCVVGCGNMHIDLPRKQIHFGGRLLREGDWITVDGSAGNVLGGRGEIIAQRWQDQPEVVALARIIDLALHSGDVPPEIIGQTWRIRDFFVHGIPLSRPATGKKPVHSRPCVSFAQPDNHTIEEVRSNLKSIRAEDRENFSVMLLSLGESLSRQLSSAIGLAQHHRYFRPLWDPRENIQRLDKTRRSQLIGFEFFGINRHICHLVDISTVTVLLDVELVGESDEWFLDFTNPDGESLVASSDRVLAYSLQVNDAHVSYDDVPLFYDSLRRREYFWRFYEANHTSHREILAFMSDWPNQRSISDVMTSLCTRLGLIRCGKRTASGESLLGKLRRSHKYEFIRSQE